MDLKTLLPTSASQVLLYAANDGPKVGAVGLDFIALLHPPSRPGETRLYLLIVRCSCVKGNSFGVLCSFNFFIHFSLS